MTTHQFQPSTYFNTFGSNPPALHIGDGDQVITTTVDAEGSDAQGQTVAGRPNPQTGPFYVEGAEPGDTLQVSLEALAPNREIGYSYTMLAPNVVDPAYARRLPERERAEWRIDSAGGSAALLTPLAGLPRLSLPLNLMLGCLGVAPEGAQFIATSTSGPYGGNMDYVGFTSGVTAYFPVFVPGALLHLGDGHAIQGDGELVGTGIEISFDVRFTVHVLKGKTIHWPRGENADYIFTVGNARPLDQALQHATTEMCLWLQEDYGLNEHAASTLMGMCARYDLGNIFDPAYTMVCKIPRQALASIR
jgi:amidase